MSLKKEIVSENGAVALYHRIGNIKKNYGFLDVTIDSYAQEGYRDSEKELSGLIAERETLIEKLYVLTAKGELTEDEKLEINKLNIKMDRMQELSAQHGFSLFQTVITLAVSDTDGISFQEIYSRLKTETEVFGDAEDC